ncbi:MAG: hypothetical protein F4Z01_03620 [Gammaproteobacteria bacterium]|nr:hypothetical protein [Gammaproteobacteria bacterium]MYF39171.1 hypothetical protein [Gammaproteobacteria bacterium]
MSSGASRIPNFAGIALVDILANGVAVLIIVIVISIAVRAEKEERYTEKVQEIATVMTREFSISLVLNRLAASPPAQLHDYETADIDAIWHPEVMPVLEFHRTLVRDPYSGTVWTREQLLEKPNTLDLFIEAMSESARRSIRGDIYDVGTYYLVMSILKDHGLGIWHWHFVGGSGGLAGSGSAADCPPGVSFEDCARLEGANIAELPGLPELEGWMDGNTDEDDSALDEFTQSWPPEDGEYGEGTEWSDDPTVANPDVPEGSSLGQTAPIDPFDPSAMGSFPAARPPSGPPTSGQPSGNTGSVQAPENETFSIRLADPDTQNDSGEGVPIELPDPDQILYAVMLFLIDIQDFLDQDIPPTRLIRDYMLELTNNVDRIDSLSDEDYEIVEDLLQSLLNFSGPVDESTPLEPLEVNLRTVEDLQYSQIRVVPNRLLYDVEVITDGSISDLGSNTAFLRLSLNKYPDVWEGLQVDLHRGSVLLMPESDESTTYPSWRAVAFVSMTLSDVIVGFVYGTVDEYGLLSVDADSNRIYLGSQEITPASEGWFFGVKSWLVTLYVLLALAVAAFLIFWRPGLRRA